ncbi:MAG TPA: hypothetical protein VGJ05_06885 [Fimbriiglobus sp.]|jgi:hypothetical protein
MRFVRPLVVVVLTVAGCQAPVPPHVAVYPVEGQLLVSGVPAADAHITFHPLDGKGVPVTGRTGRDGSFTLTSFTPGDGAPAGEYSVTVVWPNDSIVRDECADTTTHDRLNKAYSDPAAKKIVVVVKPEPNHITLRVAVTSAGWSLPPKR